MLKFIRVPFLWLIHVYQKFFSLDHGIFSGLFPYGFCRFTPTCSEYGYQAIKKYGVFKGGALTCWRVLRCHPFSKGGYDPVSNSDGDNQKKLE